MAVNIGPLRKRPFRQKLKKDEEVSQGMCKRDQLVARLYGKRTAGMFKR